MKPRSADPSQIEMRYDAPVDPAAVASMRDVERVVELLRVERQLTAKEIVLRLGLPDTENSKRKVRAIASAARPGILSHANSSGYMLTANATLDEIWACINTWDAASRYALQAKAAYLEALHSREGDRGLPACLHNPGAENSRP